MPVNRIARLAVAGLSMACVLIVSACGSEDATPTRTSVDPANVSPAQLPALPRVTGARGAHADVMLDECPVANDRATARGTLTNSTDATTDYAITISWVNERSDVMARAVVVERDVRAGERRSWRASAPAGRASSDDCTVFAQSGTVRPEG